MTPEEQAEARHNRIEQGIRDQIAVTKRRLMALAGELELHISRREDIIKGTADFIRALRQDAS